MMNSPFPHLQLGKLHLIGDAEYSYLLEALEQRKRISRELTTLQQHCTAQEKELDTLRSDAAERVANDELTEQNRALAEQLDKAPTRRRR